VIGHSADDSFSVKSQVTRTGASYIIYLYIYVCGWGGGGGCKNTFFVIPFYLQYVGPGFTQPLTEMSTRNIIFLGSKVRRVLRADNLTAICEPIV
jgi:hypothetical protein